MSRAAPSSRPRWGPLSAPRPTEGERDLRSAERRRGEALVTLVRRAVEAAGEVPSGQKAMLVVTVEHETLRTAVTGAGETVAGSESGVLLAPGTVRRLACDAAVLPVVLGAESEVLDVGRSKRLFTAGQVRRLWLRDRCCTYPGCDLPGQWCDAQHILSKGGFMNTNGEAPNEDPETRGGVLPHQRRQERQGGWGRPSA
ncbi:DUF222 domain-containing protein [Oryzobacter terrae]|uniref:DUF222 domain-containing protein n=1 Tax=Oryzobacter terrae TaxID=1620385 RepID=UPI0036728C35